ncbi:MAG: hypothetical protein KJZ83_00040 [Burkholderiaceae bacterium]|nr:hypothetical protein [Burkholderiaceae bacterium]
MEQLEVRSTDYFDLLPGREGLPRTHNNGKGDWAVHIVAGERNVLLYSAANRLFEITVLEVDPEAYVEVGY